MTSASMVYVVHALVGQEPVRLIFADSDDATEAAVKLTSATGAEARVEEVLPQNRPVLSPYEEGRGRLLRRYLASL